MCASALILSPPEQKKFDDYHSDISSFSKTASICTLVATLLILGGSIAIASSCTCLGIKGINVMRQVVLPGILPGSIAILASIPFMIKSCKNNTFLDSRHKQYLEKDIKSIFENRTTLNDAQLATFIQTELVKKEWNKFYTQFFLTSIIQDFSKDKDNQAVSSTVKKRNEQITKAATTALKKAFEKPKKSKKKALKT